jgi:hypothetical protein
MQEDGKVDASCQVQEDGQPLGCAGPDGLRIPEPIQPVPGQPDLAHGDQRPAVTLDLGHDLLQLTIAQLEPLGVQAEGRSDLGEPPAKLEHRAVGRGVAPHCHDPRHPRRARPLEDAGKIGIPAVGEVAVGVDQLVARPTGRRRSSARS